MKVQSIRLLLVLLPTILASTTYGNQGSRFIEEVTIVGERVDESQVIGAAHHLGADRLAEMLHADIQRVVRDIPGVSVQVEDGYGLRPNISIRGVATERSGRITLLEDNILIAPAPYSAPSAYYFPTSGRMHAIEVVKGPAAITQGPYTIGGALNMVSTPIPQGRRGSALLEAGEDATYRAHATYGGSDGNSGFGFLLETHQWRSDGFQDMDRGAGDTGLELEDYTVKLAHASEDERHAVELKLQYAKQDSDQSYLGLTDADFKENPYRRYGLSVLDHIHTEHEQQILRYQFNINDAMTFTATAYNNEHERNWFKTEGIDFDGSSSAWDFSRTSWSGVVSAINRGNPIGDLAPAELSAILDGSADTLPGSIQVRSNAREYYSRGIQFGFNWQVGSGKVGHDIEVGLGFHEDEEDRLQRNSSYHQEKGHLLLDDAGLAGNAGNRIQQAEARAMYIHDRIEFGDWVLTPGIRYENISQERIRYEIRFGRTNEPSSRDAGNLRDTRSNDTEVWLPGIGLRYGFSDHYQLIAGVHKGFTAPSNAPDVDEEEAINYELGIHHQSDGLTTQAIYFLSDYDNILGECTASSGADCTIGDAFNGDAAKVQGIELMFTTTLAATAGYTIPLSFNYTRIDSEFEADIAGTDFFGDVTRGDPIPYIPEQQFNIRLGLEVDRWSAYLSANHVGEVCTRASCDRFEKTDATTLVDLTAHYALNDKVTLHGKVDNATGQDNIMGRQPYGARPDKGRTASLGVRITF